MKGCPAGSGGAVPLSERVWVKNVIKGVLRILPDREFMNFYIRIPALCRYLHSSFKDAWGLFEAGLVRHTDTEMIVMKEEVLLLTNS